MSFNIDPDSVLAEMERMNVSPFDKKAKATPDMTKQIRSWADEMHDVIFDLEEESLAIKPTDEADTLLDRLRDVYRSMEDLLDLMRDESRSPNSPHRSARIW